MMENSLLIGLIRITEGKPALSEKMSWSYWWSPAWAHIKLTGLSLKLFTTPLIIYKYTDLYYSEESRILGKKAITQSGIDKSAQFYFHL